MLSIILSLILAALLGVLFLGVWYIRQLLVLLRDMEDTKEDLLFRVADFSAHVKSLHEMEMFYGDQTLGGLIEHSRDLTEFLDHWGTHFIQQEEEETLGEEV